MYNRQQGGENERSLQWEAKAKEAKVVAKEEREVKVAAEGHLREKEEAKAKEAAKARVTKELVRQRESNVVGKLQRSAAGKLTAQLRKGRKRAGTHAINFTSE
jgi:hypothetical protein